MQGLAWAGPGRSDILMENPNPVIYEKAPRRTHLLTTPPDKVSPEYIFELVRDINDPEYPNTLEQLAVVRCEHITVDLSRYYVRVDFTPTIPHCSMATLIGLCIRVRLMRALPYAYEVDVVVWEGAHVAEDAINKQLNDKERVAAALENPHLVSVVEQCLSSEPKFGIALSIS